MSSMFRMAPAAMVLAGSLVLGGWASKDFVREQVGMASARVDALESRLAQTDAAVQAAQAEASAASGQARNNGQRLDQLNARVDGLEQRMQQARRPRN